MLDITIWHNPRCSKSREACNLLEERNIQHKVIKYLDENLNKEILLNIQKKLGFEDIRMLLRSKEDQYKINNISNELLSQDEIINLIIKFPKLIERPIIIKNEHAVIARPMENLIKLLG